MNKMGGNSSPRRSQRMANSNSATVQVKFVDVQVQVFQAGQGLSSESFVDL